MELIDTLWNVNTLVEFIEDASNRINRYIMECKCISWVIIIIHFFKELIDTLWNVNTTIMNEFIKKVSELIDTLWNVNI